MIPVLGDGVDEGRVRAFADACGPEVQAGLSPEAGRPVVMLVADVTEERLARALAPPTWMCLEDDSLDGAACLPRAAGDLLYARWGTATAYRLDVAQLFTQALRQRLNLGQDRTHVIRTAVHEAVANGVVHGNLGVDSSLLRSIDTFLEHTRHINDRLADPAFAGRPLIMRARREAGCLDIGVEDVGAGFDPDSVPEPDPAMRTGRGIATIRNLADEVVFADRGRRITMRFSLSQV